MRLFKFVFNMTGTIDKQNVQYFHLCLRDVVFDIVSFDDVLVNLNIHRFSRFLFTSSID